MFFELDFSAAPISISSAFFEGQNRRILGGRVQQHQFPMLIFVPQIRRLETPLQMLEKKKLLKNS